MTRVLANASASDRPEKDFYSTPAPVTHALLSFLGLKDCFLWDCACGTGAMTEVFEQRGFPFLGTDISISGGQDFLEMKELPLEENIWIITNPPYKDVAENFIKHAWSLKPRGFAMLLKSQYWHAAKRTELFNKYTPNYVCPLAFRPDFHFGAKGGSPTMEVLWTIWNYNHLAPPACQRVTKYVPLKKPSKSALELWEKVAAMEELDERAMRSNRDIRDGLAPQS